MKLAKLKRMMREFGGGLLLLFHFAASWNTILAEKSLAQAGFHRGEGHLGEKGSKP